jgi:hypothetical protein
MQGERCLPSALIVLIDMKARRYRAAYRALRRERGARDGLAEVAPRKDLEDGETHVRTRDRVNRRTCRSRRAST